MKQRLILCIIAMVLAGFSLNCSKNTANPGEIRYGLTTEPKTLDPLDQGNTADGRSILFNVFEGLVKPDTTGRFTPCVAESWTIEEGGLVYNFKLRQTVFFHDDSVVTANDVKFSLDTAKSLNYIGFDLIDEVKIINDDTIQVVLKTPDPEFLPYLTVGIVKAGSQDRAVKAVGTGPFYIESYTPQRNLVIKKFDKYWQRLLPEPIDIPYLNSVSFIFHDNVDSMIMSLRGGSIDGADVSGSFAAQLDNRYFDIFYSNANGTQLLALNNEYPPLDDIRVRQALTHGIDSQNIIDTAFFGQGTPSNSPVIPGLSAYYINTNPYPFNRDKAKELLEEAGYEINNKLQLEITVPSNYTMHVDTAQVIANQLSEIGVEASIKLVDWDTWLSEVYRNRKYQSTIILLDSPVASPRSFLARYHSDNGSNFINFKNSDFDRIFDSILTELNEDRRMQLYRDAQRAVTENAASVFIQDILYYRAFRRGVCTGILSYPLYATDFSTIRGSE